MTAYNDPSIGYSQPGIQYNNVGGGGGGVTDDSVHDASGGKGGDGQVYILCF